MKEMKRILSLVLCFVMLVGMMPAIALNADAAEGDPHYLMFATDRHANTSVIGNVINNMESTIGENMLEYLALAGDMVGSGDNHPGYDSSEVLTEVTNATSSLSAANVDIVAGIHDMNVTDSVGIVLPYQGGGAQIYEGDDYYVYGVEEYCISEDSNESVWEAQAQAFVDWANGEKIDKTKVIFVASHYPLHVQRNDNLGAYYWHKALNTVATGAASGDSTVERNIVFFHGHNHTTDSEEYVYNVGDTMKIQNGSSSVSDTIYYTYATAGYLNQNKKATLVTLTDDTIVLTKYSTSGSGTVMTTVERVVTETAPTVNTVTSETTYVDDNGDIQTNGNDISATGLGLTGVSALWNEDAAANTAFRDCVAYDVTLEGYIEGETVTLTFNLNDMTAADLVVYADGVQVEPTVVENDGYISVTVNTTAATGTYTIGYPAAAEDAVLTGLTITSNPSITSYTIMDAIDGKLCLDITGLVVTATYDNGQAIPVEWNRFGEIADGYALTFDMTKIGTQSVGITYGEQETSFEITIYENAYSDAKEAVDAYVADVLKEGYVARDIELTNYTDGEAVRVAMAAPADANVVYHVEEDGTLTKIENAVFKNGVVTFTTDRFSPYVVGESTEIDVEDPKTATGSGETTITTKKTVYVLTTQPVAGSSYLIVNGNAAGSYYALANNSGSVAATGVTVKTDSEIGTYIELDDAADELWTVGGSYTFVNDGSYLGYTTSGNWNTTYTFGLSTTARTWSYSTSNNRLSTSVGSWSTTTYYLRYYSGWTWTNSSSDSGRSVYFYVPTEVEVETTTTASGTYSIAGTPAEVSKVVVNGTTVTLGSTLTFTPESGSATTTDTSATATYTVVDGGDPNGVISGISGNTVTFSGAYGTALVKISYTTSFGEVTNYIQVIATEPYYTLDLHKAKSTVDTVTGLTAFEEDKAYYILNEDGTYTLVDTTNATPDASVTYYRVTYSVGDEITAPVAIKGIKAGDQYGVWAVVTKYDGVLDSEGNDGEELGSVGNAIIWTSSNPSVATVDPISGIITFTGKEGTVSITATYQVGNKPSDTIVISATPSQYTIPSDGTTDFPEYPNEGAIRFDKTATAVGNFSQTGITQLELSMTGVPYTTGSEIDVVIMLDMTGSMSDTAMTAAEESAIAFAEQIVKNTDGTYNNNRVCVMAFNSGGQSGGGGSSSSTNSATYTYWSMGVLTADTWESFCTAVRGASDDQESGGTPYSAALSECRDVLAAAKTDGTGDDRKQFCVFVSDGGPTSYTYITNYDAVKAGTATTYTTSTASASGGSNQSDSNFATIATYTHEYYSTLMKDDGITMYTVLTGLVAANYPNCTTILKNIASDTSKAYVVEDGSDTSALTSAFTNIAKDILQAATDVVVEDKITDEYTMIFDIPEGTKDIAGVTNDFYIEFGKYALDENHERTTFTSVTKLYIKKNTSGVLYAASDNTGTAYAAPVFEAKVIGEKGTLLYWTTDSTKAGEAAVSYNDGTNTYYFIPYGQELNEDGTIPTGWYNMTSGAYAYGTVDATTNMSQNLVIATPYFVYNAASRMLYWTVDKLDTEEYVLRYFLYLDNSATEVGTDKETKPGSYLTNEHAYITYTNFKGNDCRQEFPMPQMTWNGAQVSYVFYLVNEAGQPINKSGQIVDFANATFITQVFTESVVWNEEGTEGVTELNIQYLASEKLSDDYLLYDENASYSIHVFENENAETLFNYFIIDGSAQGTTGTNGHTVSNVNTTKVYNTKAGTKYTTYGTYSNKTVGSTFTTTDADGNPITITTTQYANLDYSATTVAFAVVWRPALVEDTLVVDFGLDVLIDVVQNDGLVNTVDGISWSNSGYGSIAMNTGISPAAKLDSKPVTSDDGNFTISVENENQIRFTQNTMEFVQPAVFYYESAVAFTENSVNKTGYMYSKVTVIPATTIYYEDSFIELTSFTKSGDQWLEDDGLDGRPSNRWSVEGEVNNSVQAQDRPGTSQISYAIDADNIYGSDKAYSSMSTYSMGTSRKITVNSTQYGEATFTFYGTGFDLISLTSNKTGTITVLVQDADGETVRNTLVDTYYSFDKVSYKVTYTFQNGEWVETGAEAGECEITNAPENPAEGDTYTTCEQRWTAVNSGENDLFQVPVIEVAGLTYGKYTVTVSAVYSDFFNSTSTAGSYDLYLDAVRIYDPTGNLNDTANGAYKEDHEAWPTYQELRDIIISKETYGTLTEGETTISGGVFIDGVGLNPSIKDYTSYGPNNELYLDVNQAVIFDLASDSNVDKVHIALKVVGGDGAVKIYGVDQNGNKKTVLDSAISSATDLYYDITSLKGMTVVIQNTGLEGDAVISITNIKTTHLAAPAAPVMMFSIRRASVETALATMVEEEEIETQPTEPETEPTEPETEPTEPETEPTEPETEPTEPETEPTEPETEPTEPSVEEQIEEIVREVVKIIKGILGKLFG